MQPADLKNQPLVSVCIPCYNATATIRETIDSVLNQTYNNLEIIISDDKSTDDTVEILKTYAALDSRIKLILNEKNLGIVGNYNKAMETATGKYLKLQCADDLYTPDCIEKEVNIFLNNEDKNIVMVTSEKIIIDGTGKRLFRKNFPCKFGLHKGKKIVKKIIRQGRNIIGEPGCPLLLREVISVAGNVNIPKELTYLTELDWWCRILMQGDLYLIKEPLFFYRVVETSDSVKQQRWKQAKQFNKWVNEIMDNKIIKLSWFDKAMSFVFSWFWCIARNIIYVFINNNKK